MIMLKKVKETIIKHNMLDKGGRVIVAVSGGPDSVALLKALHIISDEYHLFLIAAHFNHGLRGDESDSDESFVKNLSKSMGVVFESGYVDIPSLIKKKGGSTEVICRNERYKFLEDIQKKYRADKIALGHNLGDQAETVIIKFLRGSGMEGLRGILPVRDSIYIRPLISVTREEILNFLKKEDVKYVTDSSNTEDTYLRNRIRGRLIPELMENYNPRLVENLGRMANIIRTEDDYIKMTVEEILESWNINRSEGEIRIKLPELVKLHKAIQWRIVKTLLQNYSPSKKGIGYIHVKSVMDLVEGDNPSGTLNLPFYLEVRREYDLIILSKKKPDTDSTFCYGVEIPGSVDIKELGITVQFHLIDNVPPINFNANSTVLMDYEQISFPLTIRNVKSGDRFQPFGMNGTKKLKSFFIDEKIPKNRRRKIPILADQKSVLWIMGTRLCERVKITDKTRKVVKVEIV